MSGFNRVHSKTSRGMILQSCMGILAALTSLTSSGVLMQCGGCFLFPNPAPTVSAGGDQTVALGVNGSATAVASGTTGTVTYSWERVSGGALIGVTTNPTVNFSCPTTAGDTVLRVTLTDSDKPGCPATDDVTIHCSGEAAGSLNVSAGVDSTALQGQTVVLTATTTGGTPPIGFSWLLTGSGSAGTAAIVAADTQTPLVTFSADALGTFTFQATATDANGVSDSDSVAVTVSVAPPAASSLIFTLDIETKIGTDADNTFSAPLLFNGGTGELISTLQTGDEGDGLGGNDTLNATLNNNGGSTITPKLVSIEILNLTLQSDMDLDMVNSTGITNINSLNSSGSLDIFDLDAIPSLSLINAADGASLFVFFNDSVVSGDADVLNLALNNTPNTEIESEGIETLNVASNGTVDNALDADLDSDLLTIKVTGAAALDLEDLSSTGASSVETLDASGSTGGVTVVAADTDFTFTGGTGDDSVTFNDGEFDSNDTANGGAGKDTLGMSSGDAEDITTTGDALTNVSNFEILDVFNSIDGDIDTTLFNLTSPSTFVSDDGFDFADSTVTLKSGDTASVKSDSGVVNVTFLIGDSSTTTDTMSLKLKSADFPGSLNFDGVETVNASVSSGSVTIADLEMAPSDPAGPSIGTTTFNISGDQDVVIDFTNAETINASTLTGDLDVFGANAAISLTGGSGDDELDGSAEADSINGGDGDDTIDGGDGDDAIDGGAGDDIIEGGPGKDFMTGGTGTNTYDTFDGDSGGTPDDATFDEITDFQKGIDVIDDDDALFVVENATASVGVAKIDAEGIATFNAADDTLNERITAVAAAITAGGTAFGAFAIFEFNGDSFVFISDSTDGVTSTDDLIRLDGVTGLTTTTIDVDDNITIE